MNKKHGYIPWEYAIIVCAVTLLVVIVVVLLTTLFGTGV